MKNKAKIVGEVQNGFSDFIKTATASSRFTLIGDGNHTTPEINAFLGTEQFMKDLAEAGNLHVCLEIPIQHQDLADALHNQQITKDEYVDLMKQRVTQHNNAGDVSLDETLNRMATQIDAARKYGMKAHCVDPGNRYDTSTRQGMRKRLDDTELSKNILNATKGEKTAVIYGSAHDHVAQILKPSTVIDIRKNDADFTRDRHSHKNFPKIEGAPDFVYNVEEAKIYSTDRAEDREIAGLDITDTPSCINDNIFCAPTSPPFIPNF
ncbi:MAG: hypothetical protein GW778_05190 [Alphaproteobacteria bacterium]|nr:hypothetical protein [Alphaproteobacteria bacterium]